MPRSSNYTLAYDDGAGSTVELCKVIFGSDGSYYITAPYHPLNQAVAAKVVVNYADDDPDLLAFDEALEVGVLDDDDRRLKLAHHPDGFLQFSGQGIRSGLDDEGRPRGIGSFSWPLLQPAFGPSFQLIFSDPLACGQPSAHRARTMVLRELDIEHMRRGITGLAIYGYYFPPIWREVVWS